MKVLVLFLAFFSFATCVAQGSYKWSPPILSVDSPLFEDSTKVSILFGAKEAQLMLSINGEAATEYNQPIFVSKSASLIAFATGGDLDDSDYVYESAVKNGSVILNDLIRVTRASDNYPETNNEIINRVGASKSYADPEWVGYDADSVVFEFSTSENVTEIGVSYLNDLGAWILPPRGYHISASSNGQSVFNFTQMTVLSPADNLLFKGAKFFNSSLGEKDLNWRIIVYPSILPSGHPGEGTKAWLFIDELIVN